MNRIAAARFISIAGHPFTFILLLLLLSAWNRDRAEALRVSVVVTVVALFPLGIFCWRRFTTGRWSTVDASHPAERPALFTAAFAALLPISIYFLLVEHSSALVRGSAAIAFMLALAAILNRWIKLSGHLAFAGFAGSILGAIHLNYGIAIASFIPFLAWSRLAMLRHTLPEVLGGLTGGILIAELLLWSL